MKSKPKLKPEPEPEIQRQGGFLIGKIHRTA
jgi:hypothetical protein